ncbi:MAG: TPM domain-containing protein [Planctomycetota bacterium]
MRKLILAVVLVALSGLWLPAREVPDAKGYVSDYAGLLTPAEAQALDQKLRAYDQQTTNQVVVLIVKSLKGETVESLGIKVMDKWKPGQKGKDNGVIFIIAKEDRKTRIEVGYGLESSLTDLECAMILERIVKPEFRAGRYYAGIESALSSIVKAIGGNLDYAPVSHNNRAPEVKQISEEGLLVIFIIIAIFVIIGIIFGLKYGHQGGGTWSTSSSDSGGWSGSSWGGGFSGGGGGGGGGGASGGW